MTTGGKNDRDKFEYEEDGLELPALPPVIFGIPIAVGAIIDVFIWSGDIIGGAIGLVVGIVLMLVGVWVIFWAIRVMNAHDEHPEPHLATETLVMNGPFKRTRNPIYSGFLLIGAGIAITLNAMAMLVAVFFGVAALTALVIRREEAYLERKFGEAYIKYANKTGRWL
ncbi:MAG: isoprenylcysteine carboxylmethyltransferase family protein [Dehalococcoidia bacterium]|nr:isoprenylcysteine carboxylmethyltransferase family protein [Dehalococcoidia bacterium]